MNNRKLSKLALATAGISCLCGALSADVLYNPTPGTGSYRTIPEFEFNRPLGPIPSGGYTGAGGLFFAGPGSGTVVPNGAIGNGGSVTINSSFVGPGSGIIWNNVMAVTAGQSYVISGWAKISPGVTSNVYIDLWDVPGDRNVHFDKTFSSGWQFSYETFTAPSTMVVGARAILDFQVSAGDSVIFDDVAITPLANFVAPTVTPVPEPQLHLYAMIAGAALVGFGSWRRSRR